MRQMYLGDWRTIILFGELISAFLFLFPKTNKIETLLLKVDMDLSITIHITGTMRIAMPSVTFILIRVIGFIRNPNLHKMN